MACYPAFKPPSPRPPSRPPTDLVCGLALLDCSNSGGQLSIMELSVLLPERYCKNLHDPSSNTTLFPRSTDLPSGRLPPKVRRGPGGGTWGESGLKSGSDAMLPLLPERLHGQRPPPRLLLCLLSCQHKKVGPPAGTGTEGFYRE